MPDDLLLPLSATALLALAEQPGSGPITRTITIAGTPTTCRFAREHIRHLAVEMAYCERLRADPLAPLPPELARMPMSFTTDDDPDALRRAADELRRSGLPGRPALAATFNLSFELLGPDGQWQPRSLLWPIARLVTIGTYEKLAEDAERRRRELGLPVTPPKPPALTQPKAKTLGRRWK
jgi:hypothetical protein